MPENNDYLGSRTCEKYHIWFPLIFFVFSSWSKMEHNILIREIKYANLVRKKHLFSHSTSVLIHEIRMGNTNEI